MTVSPPEPSAAPTPVPTAPGRWSRLRGVRAHRAIIAAVGAGLVCLALVLRLAVLANAEWTIDGDEAVVGVMAQDILRGARPVFFYGQVYLGSLEAYLVAPLFALFGVSSVVLKAAPMLLSVVHVLLVYWLAVRAFNPWIGAVAGLLAAVPPLYITVNAGRALGGYPETLVFGDLLLLLAVVAAPGNRLRPAYFAAMGLTAGVGVWTHLLIAHYLLPVGLFLLVREPLLPLRLSFWIAVAWALVGSAPLWQFNLANHWATVAYFVNGAAEAGTVSLRAILIFWLQAPLSYALGIAHPWGPLSPVLGMVRALVVVAGLLWLGEHALRDSHWRRGAARSVSPAVLLLAFVLFLPVLYVVTGYGAWALLAPDIDFTGRYLLPVATVAPIVIAGLAVSLARTSVFLAVATAGAILAANAGTYTGVDYKIVFQTPYFCCWAPLPSSHTQLIANLKERGIELVIANHWVGHRLIFESERTLPAFDYFDVKAAGGSDRFPEYGELLERDPAPKLAYVLVRSPDEERLPLDDALDGLGVPYERWVTEPYVVYIPNTPVTPDQVVASLAYPY